MVLLKLTERNSRCRETSCAQCSLVVSAPAWALRGLLQKLGCGLSDRCHRHLFQCQMGSTGLFCKKPDNNYFWFCEPYHLCSNYSILLLTQDGSHGQEVSGHSLFQ